MPGFWYRLSRERRIALLALALAVVALAVAWVSHGAVSEEERVKAAVLRAVRAAEDESVDDLAAAFSPKYRGFYGIGHNDLMSLARRDFTLISDLRIKIKNWQIAVEGNQATVQIQFRVHLVFDKVGVYSNVPIDRLPSTPPNEDDRARLVLENERGQWRIVEVDVAIPEH